MSDNRAVGLNQFSFYKADAFDQYFALLNIAKETYANIHTTALKKEFLLHRYLRAEFELGAQGRNPQSDARHLAIEHAYKHILQASITEKTENSYSDFSFGLSELDIRTARKNNQEPVETYPGSILESVIKVAPKDAGVTPGFEAIQVDDVLRHVYKRYPNKVDRLNLMTQAGFDIRKLYDMFKADLTRYLVKLDYEDVENGLVVINAEDLKHANTVQKIYELGEVIGDVFVWFYARAVAGTSIEKNCEAVLEVLANDVARLFMSVQKQTLYPGYYNDGTFKLMLKAEWIKGAKTLGPVAGGKKDDNYCVVPVLIPEDGITHMSDDSITALAEKLPIFIVQNDRDAIGSRGQNKLRCGNEFVAIDFGHAYQLINSLIDRLTDDFHITDEKFKNYSIFYDVKRSEIVRGLLKLAVLNGNDVDDEVLKSYGDEFFAEIKCLKPHSDENIFNDYVNKFEELMTKFDLSHDPEAIKAENKKCCLAIIEKINAAKERHVVDRKRLVEKFEFYCSLQSSAVDLLQNLKKVSTPKDKMSMRSPDGTVLLNHLRIDDSKSAEWKASVDDKGRHTFAGSFASSELAIYAENAIRKMLPPGDQWKDYFANVVRVGNEITFVFDKQHLNPLANFFTEDKIKKKLFVKDDDYRLAERFKAERTMANLLASFKAYEVEYELSATPTQEYAIQFKKMPFSFQYCLKKELKGDYAHNEKQIEFSVPPREINKIIEQLESLQERMRTVKQAQEVFYRMAEDLTSQSRLSACMTLVLEENKAGYHLQLNYADSRDGDVCKSIWKRHLDNAGFIESQLGYFVPYGQMDVLNRELSESIADSLRAILPESSSVASHVPRLSK